MLVKKMIFILALFISVVFQYPYFADSQTLSQKLYQDIEDGELDHFSRIQAAFIISGADDPQKLTTGQQWFDNLLTDIEQKRLIKFEKVPSAERLFLYLHTTWLKEYKERATTLFDIIENREFNCVSATVLYNLTCDKVGLKTNAFETPTHVYTIFNNFGETVMVENTTSMGFNIMKNLQSYSKYIARYYPEKTAYKIGLDKLYWYENSKGREINNTELLGLICYNLAIFNTEKSNYEKSYQYVTLAQLFNQDSRSNRNFEINLYYKWGKRLFEEKKFIQAFEVIADAYYRYPDNEDFKKNCQLAYQQALQNLWIEKDWSQTEQIILEMNELKINTQIEYNFQKKILNDWLMFLRLQRRGDEAEKARALLNSLIE